MDHNKEVKKAIEKRDADILREASNGSLSAISAFTGVSRQTLYRWRKNGMPISLQSVQSRIAHPQTGLNGEKQRGRRLRDRSVPKLKGFGRKDRMRAKKTLSMAICDLREALKVRLASEGLANSGESFIYKRPFLSTSEEAELALVLRGINLLIPRDHHLPHKQFEFFLPIPTTIQTKKDQKTANHGTI